MKTFQKLKKPDLYLLLAGLIILIALDYYLIFLNNHGVFGLPIIILLNVIVACITGIMGFVLFKKHYAELRKQLNHFDSIIIQSQDAIVCVGLDHRIISWNKGAELLHGYSN